MRVAQALGRSFTHSGLVGTSKHLLDHNFLRAKSYRLTRRSDRFCMLATMALEAVALEAVARGAVAIKHGFSVATPKGQFESSRVCILEEINGYDRR